MDEKICFVAMGFGKKMDYRNSREVDLDIIYNNVIKDLFSTELQEYELIRADEIRGSDIIDVSMYTLLLKADLVIADITTMNENAIYELGIRHALRPFSTIIMMQESEKTIIPFDINHSRILTYKEIGESLEENEISEIKMSLLSFVKASEEQRTDSPLYTYLPNIVPPNLSDDDYRELVKSAKKKEENIADIVSCAEKLKNEGKFNEAIIQWKKLHQLLPSNDYVVQQLAFAQYKSIYPNETIALDEALTTIKKLEPKKSLDLETLGITGAIYKRLFKLNKNFEYLNEAISYYKKGYIIKSDYYNGENYANCLLLKTKYENLETGEKEYLIFECKMVYKEIIAIIEHKIQEGEINYWMYATLAVCFLAINDIPNYEKYEKEFIKNTPVEWEIKSHKDTVSDLKELLL